MFVTDEDRERADWPLMRDGAVATCWRPQVFEAAKADLRALGYQLIEITCQSLAQVCDDFSAASGWRDVFAFSYGWGGNFNQLDDFLYSTPQAWPGDKAICLAAFHVLVEAEPEWCDTLLDVLAAGSRIQALQGQRLLTLLQTDDANYWREGLGGVRTMWNWAEWFDANRLPGSAPLGQD